LPVHPVGFIKEIESIDPGAAVVVVSVSFGS